MTAQPAQRPGTLPPSSRSTDRRRFGLATCPSAVDSALVSQICLPRRYRALDVVHGRARGLVLAVDDVHDRRLGEDRAGRRGGFGEDALGLGAEAAVEEFDDFEDGDLAGVAGEAVAALHTALGAQDAGAAQDREELLEKLDRDVAAAREFADGHRAGAAAASKLSEGADCVRRLGRDRQHASMLTRAPDAAAAFKVG